MWKKLDILSISFKVLVAEYCCILKISQSVVVHQPLQTDKRDTIVANLLPTKISFDQVLPPHSKLIRYSPRWRQSTDTIRISCQWN